MPLPAAHLVRDTVLPRLLVPLVPGAVGRGPRRDAAGRPALYLTLDDGPHPEGTPRLLDALARHDARATVFLSATAAAAQPALVQRIVRAGHAVGSHGDAHRSAWRRLAAAVVADHARAADGLEALIGAPLAGVRPPYGRVTPALLRWARRRGLRVVLWDLMPGDFAASATPEHVAAAIRRYRRPGGIAVLHDGAPAALAAAALDLALPALAADGYCFPPLPPWPTPS